MADRPSAVRTIYHIKNGPKEMYHIDAVHALQFKDEWSATPWKEGEPQKLLIEIPTDWQDLKPTERINIAIRLGEKRAGLTSAKADEVITAEVERREADAAAQAEADARDEAKRRDEGTAKKPTVLKENRPSPERQPEAVDK